MNRVLPAVLCLALAAVFLVMGRCSPIYDSPADGNLDPAKEHQSISSSGQGEDQESTKQTKRPRQTSGSSAGFRIREKLRSIVIPKIEFEDTSVEEAIDFLRLRSIELDPATDPTQKGVSLLIRKPREESEDSEAQKPGAVLFPAEASTTRLTLQETNISLWDTLHLIAREAGLKVEITDEAVVIRPK